MKIRTMHKREEQIFRGHPNYRGTGSWKDWVWIDWGTQGKLPGHIWCFVDLEGLEVGGQRINHGGVRVEAGVYAVVETSYLDPDDDDVGRSDLLTPIRKEVDLDDDGTVGQRHFYLANTTAFLRPCSVIPDIGCESKNKYFAVTPRTEWPAEFLKWVREPHRNDEMDDMEPQEQQEELVEEEEMEVDSDENIPKALE